MNRTFPYPRTARPDPYIENGQYGYMYWNGVFRKLKSDHHSGGGSFQFNFCDDNSMYCSGWSNGYLFTAEDLKWFKSVVEKYGTDYYSKMIRSARDNDDAAYFVCWIESADLEIRLNSYKEESRGKKPKEYCILIDDFLKAFAALDL